MIVWDLDGIYKNLNLNKLMNVIEFCVLLYLEIGFICYYILFIFLKNSGFFIILLYYRKMLYLG